MSNKLWGASNKWSWVKDSKTKSSNKLQVGVGTSSK